MTATPPISVYIGDDWLFQIEVADANGVALNLTGLSPGGEFWKTFALEPTADLNLGNARVFNFVPTSGAFTLKIERALTAFVPAASAAPPSYPTRIQINWLDVNGNQTTIGIIPLNVLDPRADASVVDIPQTITIAAGGGIVVAATYPYLLAIAGGSGALDLGSGGIEPVGLGT